jgi:hypothetical protein
MKEATKRSASEALARRLPDDGGDGDAYYRERHPLCPVKVGVRACFS